jgi:hypothetical protein
MAYCVGTLFTGGNAAELHTAMIEMYVVAGQGPKRTQHSMLGGTGKASTLI